MADRTLGFIGVGRMGGRLARRLIDAGYRLTIFDTSAVRVSETKLMPDAMLPKHTHRYPHLLVAVTDLELRSEVPGKTAIPIHAKAGDVNWIKPGLTHMLLNVGKQPARFVTVEFK